MHFEAVKMNCTFVNFLLPVIYACNLPSTRLNTEMSCMLYDQVSKPLKPIIYVTYCLIFQSSQHREYLNRNILCCTLLTRIWNSLPQKLRLRNVTINEFKKLLLSYYKNALQLCYDVNDARTWKTICPKCNNSRPLSQHFTCC